MHSKIVGGFPVPQSLKMRLFAVCFIGTHIPLLSFVARQIIAGEAAWGDVAVLLVATLVGTAGALYAMHALLSPLLRSIEGVESLARGEAIDLGPIAGPDEASELLRRVNDAAATVHSRLSSLDHAAHRDLLTALLNRRGFLAQVEPFFEDAAGGAFAIIDLDRFKAVNDRFGHPVGDQVLRDFSGRLTMMCDRDTIVARWGGEEFALYFPRGDISAAQDLLDRLQASLRDMPIGPHDIDPVSFSAGLIAVRDDGVERAAERADAALYAAKRAGRARVVSEGDAASRVARAG